MPSPQVTANGQVTTRGLYPSETFSRGRRADPYKDPGRPELEANSIIQCDRLRSHFKRPRRSRANCRNPARRPTQPTPVPLPQHNANQVRPHLIAALSSSSLSKTKGPTGPPHIPPPPKIIPTRCQPCIAVFAPQIDEAHRFYNFRHLLPPHLGHCRPHRPRPQSRL